MSSTSDFLKEMGVLLGSHHEVVVVRTSEHEELERYLVLIADKLQVAFFKWTCTKGLSRSGENGSVYGSQNVGLALSFIEAATIPAVYHFQGGFDAMDQGTRQKLRDATQRFSKERGGLVISALDFTVPEDLRPRVSEVPWPKPSEEELRGLLSAVALETLQRLPKFENQLKGPDLDRFVGQLKGMTYAQAKRQILQAMTDDGKLTAEDMTRIVRAKQDLVRSDGLLELMSVPDAAEEIADLKNLKEWLQKRKNLIGDPAKSKAFNLPFPKGILLVGVQGCGKSLCAKAVAKEWRMPLVKMDPSRLFDKYIGESEKNIQKALAAAESLGQSVLWIDEIEKMFAGTGSEADGGTTTRLLGLFLTWMQERQGDVFIVATANDIQRLPPELVRKGRFDEIFFVDLPTEEVRREIFRIHLVKRGQKPAEYNLESLAKRADGFNGAEIEQVVISGCYTALNENKPLSNEILIREISMTRPLSQTMREKMDALREWSHGRTVSAH